MGDAAGGFLGVFEQRVGQLRKRLKDELEKDKPIRCRRTLKKKEEKGIRMSGIECVT